MKSILIVEDDPFVIDIYQKKLKATGFSVDIALNGEEAFKKLEEKKPDLLILDLVLPSLDGWELLGKIRKDEKLKDLKIVILSNLAQKVDVEKSLEFGIIKYFIKAHFTPSQVVKEIEKILK